MAAKKKTAANTGLAVAATRREAELLPVGEIVAYTGGSMMATMPDSVKARVKRLITVPSLIMKTPGMGRELRFDTPVRISNVVTGKKKPDGSPEDPANIANVTDIETGEVFIFLVPTVVRKNIEDLYPQDKIVGKVFYIQNLGKSKPSQRHWDFGIAETTPDNG